MRAAVSSVLAAWMFILAVSGWCCHPPTCCAHVVRSVSVMMPPTVVPPAVGCCQQCGGTDHRESDSGAPCRHQVPEKDGTTCNHICQYVGTSAQVPAIDVSVPSLDSIVSLTESLQFELLAASEIRTFDPQRLKCSQQLYLQFQQLLI